MRAYYLFEFCDQKWVPATARECLFEIMEACNSGLRSFNGEVADAVIEIATKEGLCTIIELGAGRAPVTTQLARDERADGLKLVPCDIAPNEVVYRQLASRYGGRVQPIYSSVDITQAHDLLDASVLVLAGMMHHVPFELRPKVLRALSESGSRMAMFEPLKRSFLSMFLASLSIVPAILLPITFFRRPGRLRRFFWCWVVPVVPPMFAWDGVTSCLRQWTASEWRQQFDRLGDSARDVQIQIGFNSLRILWSGRNLPDRGPTGADENRKEIS
ncbi:MAG TPA: class I SAM-dependent methyltransferase [Pirellulaceae bacterium]|nr:class I SAM-dependent methyltransferase [Pirellulaceae bacterium]